MIIFYCDDFPSSQGGRPGQHALAWALAYQALSEITGERADVFAERTGYLENGKPVIFQKTSVSEKTPSESLFFSVSHCPTCVAAAADFSPVGIDCERRFEWKEKLANRVCTETELRLLTEQSDAGKADLLGKIWSRKESYLKLTGEGLRRDLRKLEVLSVEETGEYSFLEQQNERFTLSVCGNVHGAAVCRIPYEKLKDLIITTDKM